MPDRGSVVPTVIATIATRYVGVAVGAINAIVVARAIGASGRGAVEYVIAIAASALAVAHLSVGQALLRRWAVEEDRRPMVAASLAIALVVGAALAAVGTGVSLLVDMNFPPGVDRWMVPAVLALLPFTIAVQYTKAALTNDGHFRALNSADVLTAVVHLGVLLGLWATTGLTVANVLIAWMIAAMVPVPILVAAITRHVGLGRPSGRLVRSMATTGLRFHLGTLALALVLRVDVLLLGAQVSVGQLGVYTLAVTLAELAWKVTNSISQVAVQFQLADNHDDANRTTAYVFRVNLVVATAMILGAAVSGPWLISLVFGPSFAGTTGALLSLAIGVIGLAAQRPIGVHLTRTAPPWLINVPMVIALSVNVGLNLALIPLYGIVGAGTASSAAYFLLAIWFVVWFLRSTGLGAHQLVPRLSDLLPLLVTLRRAKALWTSR